MSNSDSKFMEGEELRNLLNKWSAPETPGSLDQRVAASYQQAAVGMNEHLSSIVDPQRGSEVVKMKFCNTCQEQFADRFSFCPVDGTPLNALPAPEPAVTKAAAAADIETSYPVSETAAQEVKLATPSPKIPVTVAAPAAGAFG